MTEALKKEVSGILGRALAGYTEDYKHHGSDGHTYVVWGRVEEDMHAAIDAALAAVTAERDALREALKETETVYSWLQSFFNDVMSTAPEYVERCGDWNAVQYMMQDCAGIAERTRAALERSAAENTPRE